MMANNLVCLNQILIFGLMFTFVSVSGNNTTNLPATGGTGSGGTAGVTDGGTVELSSLEKGVQNIFHMVENFLDQVAKDDFLDSSTDFSSQDVIDIAKSGDFSKLRDDWQKIAGTWGGWAACIIMGLLFIIFMPIFGCVHCCCFCCCKKCGQVNSSRRKMEPRTGKCVRYTCCPLLFVFTTLMLTGCVVALISNEVLYMKNQNVDDQGTAGKLTTSLNLLKNLANNALDDILKLTSNAIVHTVDSIIVKIRESANTTADAVSNLINATSLLDGTEKIGQDAEKSVNSMSEVMNSLQKLNELNNNISNELTSIKNSINDNCDNTQPCQEVKTALNSISTGTDFSALNDLKAEAGKLNATTDIVELAKKAREDFNKISSKIHNDISAKINESVDTAEKISDDSKGDTKVINNTVQLAVNIVDDANPYVKDVGDFLKTYGKYWWYGGIALPCILILTVACYYLGILFGVFGQRGGDYAPCCNHSAGANIMCFGITWSYLFSWLLMLICTLTFMVGGAAYFGACRGLNKGIENVQSIEDLIQYADANLSLSHALYPDSNVNITIGSVLRKCKNNNTVYQAFELKEKFDLDKIVNVTEITTKVKDLMNQPIVSLPNISIIPDDLKTKLNDFKTSGVANISFTKYENEMNKDLINGSLSGVIEMLNNTANAIATQGQSDKASNLSKSVSDLENIQNNKIPELQREITNLNTSLQSLKVVSEIPSQIDDLIESLEESQAAYNTNSTVIVNEALNDVVRGITKEIKNSLDKIKNQIKNDVAKCGPMYTALQGVSDSVCVVILQPFNGFWFGLGWALFCVIPCIIIASCLGNIYRRESPYDKKKAKQHDDPNIEMYDNTINAYDNRDNVPLAKKDTKTDGEENKANGRQYTQDYGGDQGNYNHGYEDRYAGGGYRDDRSRGGYDRMQDGYRRGGSNPDLRQGPAYQGQPPSYNGNGYGDQQYYTGSKY